MINYKSGDVILVEVIFAEKNESKKRPALILSSDDYHSKRHDVIIAAITSNTTRILFGDTLIKDWERVGLKFPSLVTATIQTIKKNMIDKKIGTLTKKDMQTVIHNLAQSVFINDNL